MQISFNQSDKAGIGNIRSLSKLPGSSENNSQIILNDSMDLQKSKNQLNNLGDIKQQFTPSLFNPNVEQLKNEERMASFANMRVQSFG